MSKATTGAGIALLWAAVWFTPHKVACQQASAGASSAQIATPADPDLVFGWESSQPRRGVIKSVDENYLRFEQVLGDGVARAQVSIPRRAVRRVDFGHRADDDALVAAGDPVRLGAAWRERLDFLGIENAETGRIGLAYAEALLARGADGDAAAACEVFAKIETEDWEPARQALARSGKLRAMIASGRAEEAIAEAEKLEQDTEDPSVIIEAKYVLAMAAREQLSQLIEDNPRWFEDDWVRPERDRLYNRALNLLLYPYLFHGTRVTEAARGLWGAIEVYLEAGDKKLAAETARDLVVLYRETPEAQRAKALLADSGEDPSEEGSGQTATEGTSS